MEMINVKINGRDYSVPKNATVLEAAKFAGVDIPTLCYLKDINEIGAVFELGYRHIALCLIIGIKRTCRALDGGNAHSCTKADTLYEVNRTNNRAVKTGFILERGERGLFAGAPKPQGICLLQAATGAVDI